MYNDDLNVCYNMNNWCNIISGELRSYVSALCDMIDICDAVKECDVYHNGTFQTALPITIS